MERNDVAIVTGGARGIGFGIADALANAGYDIALVDLDAEALESAASRLRDRYPKIQTVAATADVTSSGDVARAVKQIDGVFGRVDVLVNNAGIVRDRRLSKMEEQD